MIFLFVYSPLERGRGVSVYIDMCVRKPIFVDVFHTPPPPSFIALNSPHLARIDI